MERQEMEKLLEASVELVIEEYVMPLTQALGALTMVVSRDPQQARELSEALRAHAENCPREVAGRKLLEALAELADGRVQPGPDVPQSALQRLLWLPRMGGGSSQGTDS